MRVKDAIKQLFEDLSEDEMILGCIMTMGGFNHLIDSHEESPITEDEWERIVSLVYSKKSSLTEPLTYLCLDIIDMVFDNWDTIRPQA